MSHADARLSAARAAIAAACLDALPDEALGDITLRADQRRVVARAQRALHQHGGCLVADDVGRGKTYVALALARTWQHPLVIAPAALRSLWSEAALRAGVACCITSHESLSRARLPCMPFDGIIVDESHHYRNPATRRYAALAGLAARAPLVMLSATPLQNRSSDLAAQVALFAGERAFQLDLPALSRFVIRSGEPMDAIMPAVAPPEWIDTGADDGCVLAAILDLPPPARLLDGGDAGVLRTIGLVRAWASSRAALEATLRSRRRIATAIEQGADDGRVPTRREARAWHGAEDVVQLGFASLLMTGSPSDVVLEQLRSALEDDRVAMNRLLAAMRAAHDPDSARMDALQRLRAANPTSRIIAFSEYASTIVRYFSALRAESGVGMITAKDARIASGRITRDEMLARFAPVAQRVRAAPSRESVTLLLATDLLSEGVNLQDASIVVHLDLPWNPARLAQRIGRVRRPGGASEVRSYLVAPPARSALLLDAEARLRRKVKTAESVMGTSFQVMPPLSRDSMRAASPWTPPSEAFKTSAQAEGAFIARLGAWRLADRSDCSGAEGCVIAAAKAPCRAWLAALGDGRVLWSVADGVHDTMSGALRVAGLAEGSSRDPAEREVSTACETIHRWLAAEQLDDSCGIVMVEGRLRRSVLQWIGALARDLPRHRRAVALPLIARLRAALASPLPLGGEMGLARLAARATDEDPISLLTAGVELAETASRHALRPITNATRTGLVALIVMG